MPAKKTKAEKFANIVTSVKAPPVKNILPHKGPFSRVRVARELLREKAADILTEYMDIIAKAKDAGDYETAAKSLQWLIDHMPSEDGERMIEVSVDKKVEEVNRGPMGPSIQIGINLGGVAGSRELDTKPQKALPAEIIDAE